MTSTRPSSSTPPAPDGLPASRWPYGWLPSLALILTGLVSITTFGHMQYVRDHEFWFAAAVGALAGLLVAMTYNALASLFRWQTLRLADILWGDVPF